MKMKLFALAVACGFTMSFVSCGSGDPCTAASKCSADTKPTDAQIKACQDAQKDTTTKCIKETNAVTTCSQANQVCGSDNKTDGAATAAKCTKETAALTACILGGLTGDGGTP